MAGRAILLMHEHEKDPGFFGEILSQLGFSIVKITRERRDAVSLEGVDIVLSYGSDWSVYWPKIADAVAWESALLADVHAHDIPLLGICYGSQLLANLFGGSVERSPISEIGWHTITPTSKGRGLIVPGPWFQWHADRWTLPPGATLLAENDAAPQAFRLGRTFATQFHPELNESLLRYWCENADEEIVRMGGNRDRLFSDTQHQSAKAYIRAEHLLELVLV
jgi:GMP synthase-like glutamine amidotransferase